MMVKRQQHILVAPLDWGLGHATRCVPIIDELLRQGCRVSVASSGLSLALLRQEFPSLTFFELPSYQVRYSRWMPLMIGMIFRLPIFWCAIKAEHRQLENIIEEHAIDGVLSDNRYGCWTKKVKTVFITHQLNIQLPWYFRWAKSLVDAQIKRKIARFSECWVPDEADHSLAGDLANASEVKAKPVGLLSRFKLSQAPIVYTNKLLVLISGPEPQRSVFEQICVAQCKTTREQTVVVQGLPNNAQQEHHDGLVVYPHLPSPELADLIERSEVIVCRSGYSSLMDMAVLRKKKIILVPTPGQTEQGYLATRLAAKKLVVTQPQHRFNLRQALCDVANKEGLASWSTTSNLLPKTIQQWLSR